LQLEEEIQEDLKWTILVKKKLYSGKSDFQSVELVESGPFGKVRLHFAAVVSIHEKSSTSKPTIDLDDESNKDSAWTYHSRGIASQSAALV
jgi:spermidine synthase